VTTVRYIQWPLWGTYSDHCAVHIVTTVRYIQWPLCGTYSDHRAVHIVTTGLWRFKTQCTHSNHAVCTRGIHCKAKSDRWDDWTHTVCSQRLAAAYSDNSAQVLRQSAVCHSVCLSVTARLRVACGLTGIRSAAENRSWRWRAETNKVESYKETEWIHPKLKATLHLSDILC